MAPADLKDEKFSLRRFRGASGAGGRILPEWTAGDDSEDEEVMTVQRRRKARKLRSRGRPRQEKRQITPPPSEDTTDSGIDSGDESGDDGDDETSTLPPTATGTRSSSGIDRLPTQTTSEPLPTSSTGSPDPGVTVDAATVAKQQHHRNVETALTVVGSVGMFLSSHPGQVTGLADTHLPAGAVCIGVIVWALVRFFKRRRRDDSPGPSPPMPKPSRGVRFLAHIPILRTRFANRSWLNIDEPYVDDRDARAFARDDDLLGYLPEKPPAVAAENAPQLRLINVDGTGYYTTTTTTATTMQAADTNQAIASQNQPLYSPTASTLSSAFGNGTFMAPTELHPPPAARHPEQDHLRPPGYRDTVYTESSEVSSVPRFRTVNSWVRHQTSLVRQPSPPPPMPDHGSRGTG